MKWDKLHYIFYGVSVLVLWCHLQEWNVYDMTDWLPSHNNKSKAWHTTSEVNICLGRTGCQGGFRWRQTVFVDGLSGHFFWSLKNPSLLLQYLGPSTSLPTAIYGPSQSASVILLHEIISIFIKGEDGKMPTLLDLSQGSAGYLWMIE